MYVCLFLCVTPSFKKHLLNTYSVCYILSWELMIHQGWKWYKCSHEVYVLMGENQLINKYTNTWNQSGECCRKEHIRVKGNNIRKRPLTPSWETSDIYLEVSGKTSIIQYVWTETWRHLVRRAFQEEWTQTRKTLKQKKACCGQSPARRSVWPECNEYGEMSGDEIGQVVVSGHVGLGCNRANRTLLFLALSEGWNDLTHSSEHSLGIPCRVD